jgi:hypothetical protein
LLRLSRVGFGVGVRVAEGMTSSGVPEIQEEGFDVQEGSYDGPFHSQTGKHCEVDVVI